MGTGGEHAIGGHLTLDKLTFVFPAGRAKSDRAHACIFNRGGMSMPRNNYLAGIATAIAVAMMALLMPSQGQAQTDPRVQKSMELLKSMTAKLGAPRVEGTEQVGGKDAPALYFERRKIKTNFEIINELSR